jgi:glycosyltransferase involved in cell wall biosynthesis
MSRRITLVTPTTHVDGGVARHVCDSADALTQAGHEVSVVTGRAPAGPIDWRAIVVPGMEAGSEGAAGMAAEVAHAVATTRPEVVHVHHYDLPELVRLLRGQATVVVSAHGWSGCGPNTAFFGRGTVCHKPHGPACLAAIAVLGCAHRKNVLPALGSVAEAGRRLEALGTADVAVAYSGAVADHLARNDVRARVVRMPVRAPAATSWPASSAGEVALFVGRLSAVKGADRLIRAAARARVPVEVVGDGHDAGALRRLAGTLSADVRFSGWLGGAELEAAFARARLVVMPHRWPEPFGLVGVEALMRERGVIASSSGGVAEWLEDGVSGRLVRPGSVPELAGALRALWDDPARADAMGRAGRARVLERFSYAAHAASLDAAYAGTAPCA